MGTGNYNLPLISGTASVKVPRDFNALANAVDGNLYKEVSRLDSVTTSLASGAPKGSYATVAALTAAFPSGNANIYIVTADGNWYFWNNTAWQAGGLYQSVNLADNSVSVSKTDFIGLGTNLFNKNDLDIIDGSYYNYQGVLTVGASYFITGKITVKPNDVFIMPYGSAAFADGYWGTFFDQAGNRVANVGTTVSGSSRIITVPNTGSIKYMRVNGILNQKNTMMIVSGTTYPTDYIPFSRILKDDKNTLEISKVSGRVESIENQFSSSANLFDKSHAGNESGYFINYQGVKTVLASAFIAHMIPTVAGETITVKHYSTFGTNPMAVYYDGLGNSLSYLKGTISSDSKSATFVTPANASIRQVCFNGQVADINGFMIVKGATLPDYYIAKEKVLNEEFGLNARQKSYLPQNKLSRKIAVFDGDSICNAINDAQDGWAGRIASKNEMPYVNYAVDGGTITAGTMAGSNPRHWVSRSVSGYRADADYIIFEGGTNDADLIGVNNLGSISTGFNATLDDTTFSGAVESTLKQAILKYPGKKIGFIIAHKMGSVAQQQVRKTFFDRIMEICKKWGVPYLNLWETTHINPELDALRTVYYSDMQHLTTAGYDYLTPLIEDWMKHL